MRIISLVPSLTELLIDLGLIDQLVGRTKFCIHPKEIITSIPKIGGTKNARIKDILNLKPDLVIANKEENTKSDIEALQPFTKVHVTNIATFEDALAAITEIGILTDRVEESKNITSKIESEFAKLQRTSTPKTACYLIWNDPMMTVGKDTYIHDMLCKCGLINVFESTTRYPTISVSAIREKNPDLILLSSEPFPFKQMHVESYKQTFPESKVILVDGEYFSWYGSRMLKAVKYFENEIVGV